MYILQLVEVRHAELIALKSRIVFIACELLNRDIH